MPTAKEHTGFRRLVERGREIEEWEKKNLHHFVSGLLFASKLKQELEAFYPEMHFAWGQILNGENKDFLEQMEIMYEITPERLEEAEREATDAKSENVLRKAHVQTPRGKYHNKTEAEKDEGGKS